MKSKMKLGDYLVSYLEKIGVLIHHVPGAIGAQIGTGLRLLIVATVADFRHALEQAVRSSSFAIIEAMIGQRDLSPISVKYIRASARKAQIQSRA